MKISAAMLDAALAKAVEAGLIPRRCSAQEQAQNRQVMRSILEAALTAAEDRNIAQVAGGRSAVDLAIAPPMHTGGSP